MAGGPSINRTGTVCRVLGHMGRDLQRPQILDERLRVVVLVTSHRHPLSAERSRIVPAPPPVPLCRSPG